MEIADPSGRAFMVPVLKRIILVHALTSYSYICEIRFNITNSKVLVSGSCFLHLQREDAPYLVTGACITWL